MKNPKTAKYIMYTAHADELYTPDLTLSKKEFNRQLSALKKTVKEQEETDLAEEFRTHYWSKDINKDHCNITRHFFTCGCCDIVLTEYHTEDGYCFK